MVLSQKPGVGVVSRCPEGAIHLSWGYVTLHLHEQAFIELADMTQEAFAALAERRLSRLLMPPQRHHLPPC
ncbi:MAG: hypothetical protein KatS3mg131_0740 [Candidatus Tectimicrobiota bacterium]|nr:MAG: hypothetical protein KatS3mg131_0740 [Candidatus Tectomicrobia bacterium]